MRCGYMDLQMIHDVDFRRGYEMGVPRGMGLLEYSTLTPFLLLFFRSLDVFPEHHDLQIKELICTLVGRLKAYVQLIKGRVCIYKRKGCFFDLGLSGSFGSA